MLRKNFAECILEVLVQQNKSIKQIYAAEIFDFTIFDVSTILYYKELCYVKRCLGKLRRRRGVK